MHASIKSAAFAVRFSTVIYSPNLRCQHLIGLLRSVLNEFQPSFLRWEPWQIAIWMPRPLITAFSRPLFFSRAFVPRIAAKHVNCCSPPIAWRLQRRQTYGSSCPDKDPDVKKRQHVAASLLQLRQNISAVPGAVRPNLPDTSWGRSHGSPARGVRAVAAAIDANQRRVRTTDRSGTSSGENDMLKAPAPAFIGKMIRSLPFIITNARQKPVTQIFEELNSVIAARSGCCSSGAADEQPDPAFSLTKCRKFVSVFAHSPSYNGAFYHQ